MRIPSLIRKLHVEYQELCSVLGIHEQIKQTKTFVFMELRFLVFGRLPRKEKERERERERERIRHVKVL
jgi:hypothetical protein